MPQERQGAAHSIKATRKQDPSAHHQVTQGWRSVNGQSTMQGNVVSSKYVGEDPYEHRLEVTQGRKSPGFSADVDYTENVGYHGTETSQYRAGPFRTQRRAEIAAESLTNRVEAGQDADTYRVGSYYEPEDERRANREGRL